MTRGTGAGPVDEPKAALTDQSLRPAVVSRPHVCTRYVVRCRLAVSRSGERRSWRAAGWILVMSKLTFSRAAISVTDALITSETSCLIKAGAASGLTESERRAIIRMMSVLPTRDRKAERRASTTAEILDAAWSLAREQGLGGLTLRDLGDRVGMRAQSLYSYFESKDAIYDAMFRQGNEQLLARVEAEEGRSASLDPEGALRAQAHAFVDFSVEDMARAQLLLYRVLPGFTPSASAYEPAIRALELARTRLAAVGVTRPELLDMWTSVIGGLITQQFANDPGGDRWVRLVDDAIDMYLAYTRTKESNR